MIVCPQCGKMLADDVRFCVSCGFAILDDETKENAADFAATPFAVGSQTASSHTGCESGAREVPNSFWGAVMLCFRRGGPRGRSSRAEFWYWFIFNFCVVAIPLCVGILLGDAIYYSLYLRVIVCVSSIWGAVCIVPSVTLCVRRFHDLDISGVPLLVLFLAATICFVTASFMAFIRNDYFWGCIFAIACGATLGILLLSVVVVALIPGAEGVNRFGPGPEKRRKDSAKSKSLDDSSEDESHGARR